MGRNVIGGARVFVVLLCFSRLSLAAPEPQLNPDGLHTQDWFLESFLELNDDLQEAAGKGKGFAIIWEQRGCPYCRETHLINLSQPEIVDYLKANFEVLQLNTRGYREVTDFDGKKLSERELAKKYRVRFTPTVTFFGSEPGKTGDGSRTATEINRITGYYRPFHFLMAFQFVRDKAYLQQKLRQYIATKTAERKAQGKPVQFR